ncbi:MAG TPA: type II toxin-antitoxin system RelE/ParE family toxin [Acidimicrobiia bacterium]
MYEVEITPEGLRNLNQLPEKIREAALSAVLGPIAENPWRLGKPLLGELEGLTVARRGDYRIIYEILEEEQVVVMHRIQHRRDVYRRR